MYYCKVRSLGLLRPWKSDSLIDHKKNCVLRKIDPFVRSCHIFVVQHTVLICTFFDMGQYWSWAILECAGSCIISKLHNWCPPVHWQLVVYATSSIKSHSVHSITTH